MAKRYSRLRGALMAKNIDQAYLAEKMKCSIWYVSQRMCGHLDWTQGDMYFLMDMLQIPHEQMHLYFPRNGISA